ncbi:MAG: universal stress protein [Proteobacteria bacterium]|nr:universal stress protein [Pseudomonadota bacterium]
MAAADTRAKTRRVPAAAAPTARYATLLVHAEPGLMGTQRVEFAGRLARELDARLIGVAAQSLTPYVMNDPSGGYAPDERIASLVRGLEADLKDAGESFRRDAAGADLELRTVDAYPAVALAEASRAADLILLGPKSRAPNYREPDPGEVAVRAGKPVLIVPNTARHPQFDTVVIAWKDSRECRRATATALPFLQRAREVIVCGVCDHDRNEVVGAQLVEVVDCLQRQGVRAQAELAEAAGGVSQALTKALNRHEADLLVMGAYGHVRAAELVFGGVTEHFLRKPPCCVLMDH